MGLVSDFDHGELNIPGRLKNLDREIQREVERQKREARAEHRAEVKARREAEAERVRLTVDDLTGARAVRTRMGWHRVIRVNASTVTVAGEFGDWRIKHTQILEAKA